MAEPESREPDVKKREDDSPEPLTLSQPEPVEAATAPAEDGTSSDDIRSAERQNDDRALPDEAEVISETPPASEGEADPAPMAAVPPSRKPEPPRRSGPPGFFLLLVGGIAGAAGGFAYSRHAQSDWPLANYGQTQQAAALQAEIDALRGELSARPKADAASAADLKAAADRAAAAEARVAELESQLAAAASQPAAADVPDAGTLEAEIAALRAQIAQATGSAVTEAQTDAAARVAEAERQAAQLKAEVEAAARAAVTAASVGQVQAAIDAGIAYVEPLEELAAKGVESPVKLIEGAQGGVSTLAALEDDFGDAARAALAVSRRATMGDSWTSRAKAFLMTEAGIRSLKPREGTDPDAILSRADAAVQAGDLQKALAEIATLPAEGQEAMAGWTARAAQRIEATDAVAALAAAAEGK